MLDIVLVEPEIPHNTGAIARTCAATGARLHLIKPLGFDISDKMVKRCGLDYWYLVDISVYENLDEFFLKHGDKNIFLATTKAPHDYCGVAYRDEDFLVFGRETKGLDEELLARNYEKCVRIPMKADARSLNLSNSVAIMLYEALRQQDFPDLSGAGHLHHTQPEGPEWKDYI